MMTEPEEKDYDVVLDALQKHRDKLWKMTNSHEEWGIMDTLRMEQIQKLDEAIKARLTQPDGVILKNMEHPTGAPVDENADINATALEHIEIEIDKTGTWGAKEWVNLTDYELVVILNTHTDASDWGYERAIEAKLKEKNT